MWALRDRCSAYLTLAETLDARLLTTDRRLQPAADGLVEAVALP